jgi:hypothetical protein
LILRIIVNLIPAYKNSNPGDSQLEKRPMSNR